MGLQSSGTSVNRRWTWTHLAPTVALLLIAVLPVSADDAPSSAASTPDAAKDQKTSDRTTTTPAPATAPPAPASVEQPPTQAPAVASSVPAQQEEQSQAEPVIKPTVVAPATPVVHLQQAQMPDVVLTTTNPYTHSSSTQSHLPSSGGGASGGGASTTHHTTTTSAHPSSTPPHAGTTGQSVGGGGGGGVSSSHKTSSHSTSHSSSRLTPSHPSSSSHDVSSRLTPFIGSHSLSASGSTSGVVGSKSQSVSSIKPTTQTSSGISHTGLLSVSVVPMTATSTSHTTTSSIIPTSSTSATPFPDKGGVNNSGISPGGVVGIVFGVLAALIIFTVCICCLPRKLRQRRADKAARYNVDPHIQSDAENLRSSHGHNPYSPEALSGYNSVESAMRQRDNTDGRYPAITSVGGWNQNADAEPQNQYGISSPTNLLPPARTHDPFHTYAGGNHDRSMGFGTRQYNTNSDNDENPATAAANPYANPFLGRGEVEPAPVNDSDGEHIYPATGRPSYPQEGDGGRNDAIGRNLSLGSRKGSVGRRMRQKFKYRPNSTLTEEERHEAAGTLARIESHASRERDEAYDGILEQRAANRLRGGAPSLSSHTHTHSGSSYESYAQYQQPSTPSSSSSAGSPGFSRQLVGRVQPPLPAATIDPVTSSSEYESDTIQQPRSGLSPKSPYGWGNRLRGNSDAEMSHLLDLLISRSSLPDRPAAVHMQTEASFASSHDSPLHQIMALEKRRHDAGQDEWDDMSVRTFGEQSVLSARGNAPKVTVTPTSPSTTSFKERWALKYGRPI
ncbi:hypothetical protein FRB97_005241 [Tulasnella sp. 331]|nr:hypothetical protein FRB97_005241 [Tulasnella sp. 331]